MRASSASSAVGTTEIDRTLDREAEQLFDPVLAEIAKKLWPKNTAVELAVLADCTPRAIEFYLSGQRKWSGDAIAAIVSEILRRHRMRNVKIVARR